MSNNYRDIDGNKVSLDTLCRKEPAWAANVIRKLKDDIAWAKKEKELIELELQQTSDQVNIERENTQQAHREIEELHSRINNYIYEYSLEVMKDCPECANILRATTEEVTNAHRRGWEQCKMEGV